MNRGCGYIMFLLPPLLYFGKNLENTEFLAWKKNVKLLRGIRVA
jgi:hypothetical protein